MAQKGISREKRVSKDTPGIAQFRESVDEGKKRREANARKKSLKEQGVGSTIPASRKQKTQSEQPEEDESPDEEFDATLAEIRAEEARVDALRAKIAKRDGTRYKKLKTMDEPELQRLWDVGEATKPGSKTSTSVASQPGNSKVQPIGASQRILTSSKASSTRKGPPVKRKRASSPACTTPKSGSQGTKRKSDKGSLYNRRGATNAKLQSIDDTDSGSGGEAGSGTEIDEGDSDSDMEDGDGDGNGSGSKSTRESGRGKNARGKTSDFTGTVKKMVDYTTIRVCAKLASSGMFIPPHAYKALVVKSWARAATEYGVDSGNGKYALKKAHKQAIRARVNSFRSRTRDRLKPAIASVYKLMSEGRTLEEAKQYVQGLIQHRYHTKVGARPGTGHFQHDFLEEAIFESYYTGNSPVGIVYANWFDPMPLEAIAFVCAVIKWVIQQHETGKYVKGKMSFEKLREYYDEVMASLQAFQTGKQSQRCVIVQSMLFVRSMEKAGRSVLEDQPKPAETALQEDDFAEDIPTAEELKLLARGSSHGRKASKNIEKRSEHLTRNSGSESSMPRTQTNNQHSSPPPPSSSERPKTADGTEARDRRSSVSLDYEEYEDEREITRTPVVQKRAATKDVEAEEDEGDKEDEGDGEDGEGDDSASEDNGYDDESDDEATKSQPPPIKKRKGKAGLTFLTKLTGSSQKHQKLTPSEARLQGRLKLLEGTGTAGGKK